MYIYIYNMIYIISFFLSVPPIPIFSIFPSPEGAYPCLPPPFPPCVRLSLSLSLRPSVPPSLRSNPAPAPPAFPYKSINVTCGHGVDSGDSFTAGFLMLCICVYMILNDKAGGRGVGCARFLRRRLLNIILYYIILYYILK